MEQRQNNPLLTLPSAIIMGAAIIAIAIIWTQKPQPTNGIAAVGNTPPMEVNIAAITETDHILGNPNAPIKIVEYSDASCPFCKTFHPTMKRIMEEYGASGKVAWVYRHFPLNKPDANGRVLHPNAGTEAQAMECAASLGGNEKFWSFTHTLYERTPSVTQATPEGFDPKNLPVIAKDIGLDVAAFTECLQSGRFSEKVSTSYLDGINAGVSGTPYSIIVTPSGSKIPLSGAQPYTIVKSTIDSLLANSI